MAKWKRGKVFRHRGKLKRYIYKHGRKSGRKLVDASRRHYRRQNFRRFNRRWRF